MSNALDDSTQQQIRALGRLGWTLSRIQQTTGIRRETISGYLKAAGIPVRGCGRPGEGKPKPAISGEVSTDSGPPKPAIPAAVFTDLVPVEPAVAPPGRAPSASAGEPYREQITEALGRGRNAMAIWQDLVDDHGFTARYASVRRFVVKLRGTRPTEARVVITNGARRGRASRLRRRSDGPVASHGQISPHSPLCFHARALAQSGAAAHVALERADLMRAARTRLSPAWRHGESRGPR